MLFRSEHPLRLPRQVGHIHHAHAMGSQQALGQRLVRAAGQQAPVGSALLGGVVQLGNVVLAREEEVAHFFIGHGRVVGHGALAAPVDGAWRMLTGDELGWLLADDALSKPEVRALRGKAVLVGANYPGMNDVHFTPYASGLLGRSGTFMAGAEIQANLLSSLLADRFIRIDRCWQIANAGDPAEVEI